MIDHLNAYALVVDDVKKCAEFYRDKVGFKLLNQQEDDAYLQIGEKGGLVLALISWKGHSAEIPEEERVRRKHRISSNYFAVFLENADAEYERLRQNGVHFVTPPTTRPGGQRFAFFEDPEGNLWEISHFPKK
ncbi:MAG: VOC family protein [Thermoplasmata archaeon]